MAVEISFELLGIVSEAHFVPGYVRAHPFIQAIVRAFCVPGAVPGAGGAAASSLRAGGGDRP